MPSTEQPASGAAGGGPVAVFCVATPLHVLAATAVATQFEAGHRCVLLAYRPAAWQVVKPGTPWDAAAELPWPRFAPLPGPFGAFRRLRANLAEAIRQVGPCERIHLHSPVFDTEAVNYLLQGLARMPGRPSVHARILPDGVLNTRLHPLSPLRRAAAHLRRLRSLLAPELRYTPYAGCRTGAEAPFCDRIYVLPGLPHAYPAGKVQALAALAAHAGDAPLPRRALILGQPLLGVGLIDRAGLAATTAHIHAWLRAQGVETIRYKAHPRDPNRELSEAGDEEVQLDEPLEAWLAREPHAFVVGVHSTGLLTARQVCAPATRIVAFGWSAVRFKAADDRQRLRALFEQADIEFPDPAAS